MLPLHEGFHFLKLFFIPGRNGAQNISKSSSNKVAVISNLCKEIDFELLVLPVKT